MTAAQRLRFGLLWHSARSGNLGVGALTVGNMAIVRGVAAQRGIEADFTIFGPRETGAPYISGDGIENLEIDSGFLASPSGYWSALSKIDCALDIGAGDSFADIYSKRRFTLLWGTKMLAAARRVPLIFSPQTIGPFSRQPYLWLAGVAMERAEAVIARDPKSFAAIQTLAPHAKAIESVDVAFALPFDRQPKRPGKIAVGINASGLLFAGGYNSGNDYGLGFDYAALTRGIIARLRERADVEVHLFCHVNAPSMPKDDDGRIADQLAAEFPGTIRVPDFASPSDAKSYISSLDFVVAGRMHACIAAFSSGVPVVPIAYSRKFSGLFDGVLGYRHMVPVTGLDTSAATDYVLDRFDHRGDLAADIERGGHVVEERLDRYRAILASTIDSILQHKSSGN